MEPRFPRYREPTLLKPSGASKRFATKFSLLYVKFKLGVNGHSVRSFSSSFRSFARRLCSASNRFTLPNSSSWLWWERAEEVRWPCPGRNAAFGLAPPSAYCGLILRSARPISLLLLSVRPWALCGLAAYRSR